MSTRCISGDGSLLMNIQELATLHELQVNVKLVLFDNAALGLVHQQQQLFYEGNLVASPRTFPKRIGPFTSEVLVTGFHDDDGPVVLAQPQEKVPNGAKLL